MNVDAFGGGGGKRTFSTIYIYNAQMFVLIGVLIGRYIFFLICELIHDFNRGILLFLSFVSM